MSKGYTHFPGEDEILIQDGLEYKVMENAQRVVKEQKDKNFGKAYQLIKLRYPVGLKQPKTASVEPSNLDMSQENLNINDTIWRNSTYNILFKFLITIANKFKYARHKLTFLNSIVIFILNMNYSHTSNY